MNSYEGLSEFEIAALRRAPRPVDAELFERAFRRYQAVLVAFAGFDGADAEAARAAFVHQRYFGLPAEVQEGLMTIDACVEAAAPGSADAPLVHPTQDQLVVAFSAWARIGALLDSLAGCDQFEETELRGLLRVAAVAPCSRGRLRFDLARRGT